MDIHSMNFLNSHRSHRMKSLKEWKGLFTTGNISENVSK